MKRLLFTLFVFLIGLSLSAQDLSKLKELKGDKLEGVLYPFQKKGYYGFENEKGQTVIRPVFDAVKDFDMYDGKSLARVKSGGKWGLLGRNGLLVMEPQLDTILPRTCGTFVFIQDGSYGMLNDNGEIIADGLENMTIFTNEAAWFKKDGKWGYIASSGKLIFNNIYDSLPTEQILPGYYIGSSNGKYAVLKPASKTVLLEAVCDELVANEVKSLIYYRIGGKWGCAKLNNSAFIRPEYDLIRLSNINGRDVYYVDNDGMHGMLSDAGRLVVPIEYDTLELITVDVRSAFAVSQQGRKGILEIDGSVLIPVEYDDMKEMYLDGVELYMMEKDNKYGVYNTSGDELIPVSYDVLNEAQINGRSVFYTEKDGKYGLCYSNGYEAIPAIYDSMEWKQMDGNDMFVVSVDNKYGLINSNGIAVVPPVLNTNQFAQDSQCYQCVIGNTPSVSFQGKIYSWKEFDRYLSTEYNTAYKYPAIMSVLPEVMRKSSDLTRLNCLGGVMSCDIIDMVPTKMNKYDFPYVYLNRDRVILYSNYFYSSDNSISKLSINIDGVSFSFGKWVNSILKSIDSKKIAAFDEDRGTQLLANWSEMKLTMRNLSYISYGKILCSIDIYVDNYYLKRNAVILNSDGSYECSFEYPGDIYDRNQYIQSHDDFYLGSNDQLYLLSSVHGPNDKYMTKIFNKKTKKYINVDNLFVQKLVTVRGETYLIGYSSYGDFRCCRFIPSSNVVQELNINMGFLEYDQPVYPVVTPDYVALYVQNYDTPDVCMAYTKQGDYREPAPCLRYDFLEWDGIAVAAVTLNHWYDVSDATWEMIPATTAPDHYVSLSSYVFNIEKSDPSGYSVYSISIEGADDSQKWYGYIDYNAKVLTQPVYSSMPTDPPLREDIEKYRY